MNAKVSFSFDGKTMSKTILNSMHFPFDRWIFLFFNIITNDEVWSEIGVLFYYFFYIFNLDKQMFHEVVIEFIVPNTFYFLPTPCYFIVRSFDGILRFVDGIKP